MAWTKYQIGLAIILILSRSLNILSVTWSNRLVSMGSIKQHHFIHIFITAESMFVGEFICLGVYALIRCYKYRYSNDFEEASKFNPLIFLPPTLIDICSTTTLYVGLHMTFTCSFAIVRGSIILVTALFSILFLHQKIHPTMWMGIGAVCSGMVIYGIADGLYSCPINTENRQQVNLLIGGVLFVVTSRVLYAIQLVYEEKYLKLYNVPPLKAVGIEGLFGTTILGIFLIPLYHIHCTFFSSNPHNRAEDTYDAFEQLAHNYKLIIAIVLNVTSEAFFNFSSLSLIKERNATTSVVVVTLRVVVIWAFSLSIGWITFEIKKVVVMITGLLVIIFGICLYCKILFEPAVRKYILKQDSPIMPAIANDEVTESTSLLTSDSTFQSQQPSTLNSIVKSVVRSKHRK